MGWNQIRHGGQSEDMLHNVSVCASMSLLAYDDNARGSLAFNNGGWQGMRAFSNQEAKGFVAWSDTIAILAIRGSDEIADWMLNVKHSHASLRGFGVHSGFLSYAKKVAGAVSQISMPNVPCVLTGHSLGGAAAVLLPLLGLRFSNGVRHVKWITTFGAPRCLSPESAARYLTPSVFRFVRCADPVPDLPYRWIGQKFAHTGSAFALTGPGRIEGEGCSWWRRFWRRMRYAMAIVGRAEMAAGHSMVAYEEWLRPFCIRPFSVVGV